MTRMRKLNYAIIVLLALVAGACASGNSKKPPEGTLEPDKFLFEKGNENLAKKRWLVSREYFRQLVDN